MLVFHSTENPPVFTKLYKELVGWVGSDLLWDNSNLRTNLPSLYFMCECDVCCGELALILICVMKLWSDENCGKEKNLAVGIETVYGNSLRVFDFCMVKLLLDPFKTSSKLSYIYSYVYWIEKFMYATGIIHKLLFNDFFVVRVTITRL
jgi:hypothetical protein